MRKPFWKKSHQSWYCELDRKQIRLGPDKEEAEREYHLLMADREPVTSRTTVITLVDQFLWWTQKNRNEQTYEWYRLRCQSFVDFVGPKLLVVNLKPINVTHWLERKYDGRSDTYRNGLCRAVIRVFNWAQRQGLIRHNPVAGVERPSVEARETYLTAAQWKRLKAEVKTESPFYDFMVFLRETGCRPQEGRIIEARHWDRAGHRIILERKMSKGKKFKRVIRLNDAAREIVKKLALKRPEGPLFVNKFGRAWRKKSIVERFSKLEKTLGFDVSAYTLRHTFCTDALLAGVDPMTVATLMGHCNASMVMRVYGHLAQHDDFLAKKLKQATQSLSVETA